VSLINVPRTMAASEKERRSSGEAAVSRNAA
jgi:hypothetical protein